MITDSELAKLFAAFAHPSRVAILRVLLAHGPSGQQFGELSDGLRMMPSTLTHHLREMEGAGILIREVKGRTTKFHLNLTVLTGAVRQLTLLCCPDEGPLNPRNRDLDP